MRRRVLSTILAIGFLSASFPLAHAEQTLQQRYLDIYLKINDAEHLEKQGDFRGALEDFQDCYDKLAKIHQSDPNWETALVVLRMGDCRAKILDLRPKADVQIDMPATPPTAGGTPAASGSDSEEVAQLKMQLQAVQDELTLTKENLANSRAQLETYRIQLEAVNKQLAAAKNQQSVNEKMDRLLTQNKDLTAKLAAAQKELDGIKSNPKSKLAQALVQVKNLQDQLAESQESNKALQDTTTTLKQQLDQANADLVAANQKLAAAGVGSPEYQTLKRENEIMRGILTRELQEQAHRDMAKRLIQEEFDNLKLKSKVLQENLDIASSPMTPPSTDEERQLLANLRNPAPDVAPAPGASPNTFTAPVTPAGAAADAAAGAGATANPPAANANGNAPAAPAGSATAGGNAVTVAEPGAAAAPATPPAPAADNTAAPTTNGGPPVNIVMNSDPAASNAAPSQENTPAAPGAPAAPSSPPNAAQVAATSSTPPSASPASNPPAAAPDPNAPLSPASGTPAAAPSGQQTAATAPATPPAAAPSGDVPPAPSGDTHTALPPAQTTVTDTTITNGIPTNGGTSATPAQPPSNSPANGDQYSVKARLPDDMRETAQEAADLFKNQKYDESAAKYQSIIDKYPESLYAWSNLGVVRFQQGKFDEALKALQQAVKLSPTDAFSYANLGIVYYQLNQFENAIDALNSAKALDPNDPKTHNYLGCACSQKGWQEVAEKEFRKAIDLDQNFGDAHFNLALVYATSKPPALELARREYNKALELGIAKDQRLEKLLEQPEPTSTAQASPTGP